MSGVTGAVGQLLIAEMLIEQYFLVARRVAGAVELDPGKLELQIADANRVYEGVWDHLDQARTMLAEAQLDVSAYDALRAEQGTTTHMGVSDFQRGEWKVDVLRSVAVMGLAFSQSVSVRLNIAGAIYARQGLALLAASTPGVDWDAARAAATTVPESGRRFELGRGPGALAMLGLGLFVGLVAVTLTPPSKAASASCDDAAEIVMRSAGELRHCTRSDGPAGVACGVRIARDGDTIMGEFHPSYAPVREPLAEIRQGLRDTGDALEGLATSSDTSELSAASARFEAGFVALAGACKYELDRGAKE